MESAIPDEDFQEENDFAGIGMRGAVASSGMVDPFANQQQPRRNQQNAFDNDLNSAAAVVGQQNLNYYADMPLGPQYQSNSKNNNNNRPGAQSSESAATYSAAAAPSNDPHSPVSIDDLE